VLGPNIDFIGLELCSKRHGENKDCRDIFSITKLVEHWVDAKIIGTI
jgi:hypothetical protein